MRKKKTKREKNEEIRKRYDAIKNMMSTFAMSTVAVVSAVILIPASPKAEIIKTVSLEEQIVYQVNVTDEENALDLSTLNVVLENQLEYYEQSISLGENSGYFSDLEYNTEYRLSVYGNKGFGQERLDTLLVSTNPKIGGTILSVTPVESHHGSNFLVDLHVHDPDLKYSSITLYYGYQSEPDEDIIYDSIPITNTLLDIELFDIFTSNQVHIYLEGITESGPELLDEIWVTPPFTLHTSLYIKHINQDQITFSLYGDSSVEDITYRFNTYLGNKLLKTEDITLTDYHEGTEIIIDNLEKDTLYNFECIAVFTNPQTLRIEERSIYTEEAKTLNTYSFTIDVVDLGDVSEVTITVFDPYDYFQNVSVAMYDTSSGTNQYHHGNTLILEVAGEEKFITFTLNHPDIEAYLIQLGLRNQTDYKVYQTIKEISNE